MRTLRARLVLGTGIGATAVLLAAGALLYALIDQALWQSFDTSLAAKARALAAMSEQDNGRIELEFTEANLPEFRPGGGEYYQVWGIGDNKPVAQSASLEGGALPRVAGAADEPVFRSVTLPDGRAGRIVSLRFVPRHEDDESATVEPIVATIVLGRETADIEGVLARIRLVLVLVGAAAVLVTVAVLAGLIRRGLAPVNQLASQIAGIGERDLGARVRPANEPQELAPIVERLNEMLARLEAAFRRERCFTADVAHELRTPLAGMRSTLEVALTRDRAAADYRAAIEECLAATRHMHTLVDDLLCLARADAEQLEVRRGTVDLAALVRECWKPLADEADRRRLATEWDLPEQCVVQSDAGKLRAIVGNVLSNVVTHADEGGTVRVALRGQDAQAELTVANPCRGLGPGDVARVFDRFWRKDTSRSGAGRHFGLGLSLCRALIHVIGGTIEASLAEDGAFSVRIRLDTFMTSR